MGKQVEAARMSVPARIGASMRGARKVWKASRQAGVIHGVAANTIAFWMSAGLSAHIAS